ncbi:MAG: glycosyltransferase [Flavobacteriaceae bacterium]
MRTILLVSNEFFPSRGGLEKSAMNIAKMLDDLPDTSVQVAAMSPKYENLEYSRTIDGIHIHYMAAKLKEVYAPFMQKRLPIREKHRTNILGLSNLVKEIQNTPGSGQIILISFFIYDCGFMAQRVAHDFGIPHIASIRGSDYSIGFQSPYTTHVIEYVVENANSIVTTNLTQAHGIKTACHRNDPIETIYNFLPEIETLESDLKKPDKQVSIFSDSGFSFKKATNILLLAVENLIEKNPDIKLTICGEIKSDEAVYWKNRIQELKGKYPDHFEYLGYLDHSLVKEKLKESDLFASSTLGEGCSNSRLLALALGKVIVSTENGELKDLASDASHVFLAPSGDPDRFRESLQEAISKLRKGEIKVDIELVAAVKKRVSYSKIKNQWKNVVDSVTSKPNNTSIRKQPRILFFGHDGAGLGHLRRLSRIAEGLQGPCACLVVTGHRQVGSIISSDCEFVHLPSIDSLLEERSKYWNREPFLKLPVKKARAFRKKMLEETIQMFDPDAIFMDYLPLGKHNEMLNIIENFSCKKYFIIRGVLDDPKNIRKEVLPGRSEELLEEKYDRIFVTCDERIVNISKEYGFSDKLLSKSKVVGYVAPSPLNDEILSYRTMRGIQSDQKWVVCSAGGGKLGESLIEECIKIAPEFPDVIFDIVIGPRSKLISHYKSDIVLKGNMRIYQQSYNLPILHAAADIVISSAGYNSMVESISGGSKLICAPSQIDKDDEQYIHTKRLKDFYPLDIVNEIDQLKEVLEKSINEVNGRAKNPLDFNGISQIRTIVFKDLNVE